VGVVVAFGPEVAWSDIFASSELFNSYCQNFCAAMSLSDDRPGIPVGLHSTTPGFLRPATGHSRRNPSPGFTSGANSPKDACRNRAGRADAQASHAPLDAGPSRKLMRPGNGNWFRCRHGSSQSEKRPEKCDAGGSGGFSRNKPVGTKRVACAVSTAVRISAECARGIRCR